MKYIRELYTRVITGESASDILSGLDPMNKGHTGEALLRLLILFGIHPIDPSATVIPYHADPDSRRLEPILTLCDRLAIIQHGLINAGGSNKIDVCWGDGTKRAVCSSKIGQLKIKSIADLEIVDMLVQFTKSGGYTEKGRLVAPNTVIAYVLVDNSDAVLALAERSKSSNQVTKDNLNCLDVSDLNRMCAVFRSRIERCESKDPEAILGDLLSDEKPSLCTRFHQKLICSKVMNQIALGQKTLLIGALPRSGKTWMGAFIAKHFQKILVITTRPGETRSQWNRVFNNHREFSTYRVIDLDSTTSSKVAQSNIKNESIVAIVSTQYLKIVEREDLKGLGWDLVLLDEIHEGGSTDLTGDMLDTYIGGAPIRVMMTATYTKPVQYFTIPSECCFFWDLEDVRLMRSWGGVGVFERLCEKYGDLEVTQARKDTYASGQTDTTILASYTNAPRIGILTTVMQQDIYEQLRNTTADSVYGFSMRTLFMTTADGKAFQNQKAVDTFLALLSGSDRMKYYKERDMSMFARILRYWKVIHHRKMDEFMTQMWFLPSGTGQLLESVKTALISRIQANPVLKNFATMTLDSGMGDISKAVTSATIDAQALGKRGLILLTGNVGSLGVSLPEVDVAFMLHDIGSADMNYQQMMRVGTEMLDKRMGLVVDFNVWRVLTTLNIYATSRCGQANKSSGDRINWCISHLIDVDPDLWDCRDSPMAVPKETIAERLTQEWRKMLEKTGSSLSVLARKPFDLGEDQKLLDHIATYIEEGSAKSRIELNEDQEALNNGIEVRSCSNSIASDSKSEKHEEEKEEEPILKKANLNDVLSRLIPEFAILSGCKTDLLQAIRAILSVPKQHTAINEFLIELYSQYKDISSSSHSPLSILSILIQRHYVNLNDAREIFEVISNRMSILDNPKELIAFLGQHLKPKELEKKQNGEVFTPPDLIQQKFDKLTLANPKIWSDPSKKFLDPANGIGNYPALVFHRLMEGLKDKIPNEADRKKHILENMLYMCELNAKNVEVSRKIFDPENRYALNIYQGSYLDLDTKKEWGVEKFDVILGNPPYQDTTGNKGVGHMLWVTFVNKSLSLLKENGFLVFVHPAGWRQPENNILEKFKNLQMHYLSIHDENDGYSTFHCNTRYDWYVIQNCKNYKKTHIECQDKTLVEIDITKLPFIPNYDFNLIQALTNSPIKCTIVHSESAYECRKPWISTTKNGEFVNPVVYSVNRQNVEKLRWSKRTDRGHFGIPKVIFGSGATGFIIDETGKYGLTQWAKAISDDVANLKHICDVLNSVEFMKVIRACSIGKAEINIKVLRLFNKDFWKHFQTPTTTLKVKPSLPVNEIVNTDPVVQPVVPTTQPDYKKMKVSDLKQLCKDRKIKGITGKSKEELIAMLIGETTILPVSPVVQVSEPPKIKKLVLIRKKI